MSSCIVAAVYCPSLPMAEDVHCKTLIFDTTDSELSKTPVAYSQAKTTRAKQLYVCLIQKCFNIDLEKTNSPRIQNTNCLKIQVGRTRRQVETEKFYGP